MGKKKKKSATTTSSSTREKDRGLHFVPNHVTIATDTTTAHAKAPDVVTQPETEARKKCTMKKCTRKQKTSSDGKKHDSTKSKPRRKINKACPCNGDQHSGCRSSYVYEDTGEPAPLSDDEKYTAKDAVTKECQKCFNLSRREMTTCSQCTELACPDCWDTCAGVGCRKGWCTGCVQLLRDADGEAWEKHMVPPDHNEDEPVYCCGDDTCKIQASVSYWMKQYLDLPPTSQVLHFPHQSSSSSTSYSSSYSPHSSSSSPLLSSSSSSLLASSSSSSSSSSSLSSLSSSSSSSSSSSLSSLSSSSSSSHPSSLSSLSSSSSSSTLIAVASSSDARMTKKGSTSAAITTTVSTSMSSVKCVQPKITAELLTKLETDANDLCRRLLFLGSDNHCVITRVVKWPRLDCAHVDLQHTHDSERQLEWGIRCACGLQLVVRHQGRPTKCDHCVKRPVCIKGFAWRYDCECDNHGQYNYLYPERDPDRFNKWMHDFMHLDVQHLFTSSIYFKSATPDQELAKGGIE